MIPTGQFWHSTRGQLVRMLRFAEHTVAELAQRVRLTENAVRAHLVTLERDGLVRLSGRRPGTRKPNFTYELTNKAEGLFPSAYSPVLEQTLIAVDQVLEPGQKDQLITSIGERLAAPHLAELSAMPLTQRLERSIAILEAMGGTLKCAESSGSTQLQGSGCPLAEVVHDSASSTACQIVQAMLSRMLGVPVTEHCNRSGRPQCCFRFKTPADEPGTCSQAPERGPQPSESRSQSAPDDVSSAR